MKRKLSFLTGVALAGLMLGLPLFAQDAGPAPQPNAQTNFGANFIDENGNGICDRFENGTPMGSRMHRQNAQGRNFIDENGDGVCDNRGQGRMGRGHRGGRFQQGRMLHRMR